MQRFIVFVQVERIHGTAVLVEYGKVDLRSKNTYCDTKYDEPGLPLCWAYPCSDEPWAPD